MPPGPAYNWFCVLYSASEILANAARYRSAQIAGTGRPVTKRRRYDVEQYPATSAVVNTDGVTGSGIESNGVIPGGTRNAEKEQSSHLDLKKSDGFSETKTEPDASVTSNASHERKPFDGATALKDSEVSTPAPAFNIPAEEATVIPLQPAEKYKPPTSQAEVIPDIVSDTPPADIKQEPLPVRTLRSSKVPSSRIGRLFHYGGLAASLGYGAASEIIRRTGGKSTESSSSLMMTEANIKRLVSKLSQMRGAALKLGQFMSIQDTHVLPPEIDAIFRRVQDSAHYMPDWQMEQVMKASFGASWSTEIFASFDRIPFAAASIGQVHRAVLSKDHSPTGKEESVAVKIQFPNIVNSIESDLGYIKILLTAGKLLPRGLFLDKTMEVMKAELADECNYSREASFLKSFGSAECLGDDPRFKIPWVWEGSTSTVLVMEMVQGVSVGEANASKLSQQDRNLISAGIIELCLKELFEFRAMQTDPNWSNFLWNSNTKQIELVDFGATREYTKEFMDNWLRLLQAAASDDRAACIEHSLKLGYLTGEENEIMLNAHVNSMTLLATPFKASTPQPFSFGQGSQWADITAQIRDQIPVMLQHRLTPPPRETYSLNRKLSGSFLLASRLGAEIDTKAIWDKVVGRYTYG
ncbi:hypothetical protein CVT24_001955 [Panaeolus cyanescens]|uniref:ABC1 atypical kinase-like domain-containing protein n=1 Tax=Panaeolus cyanescens TaxID=181874 RepID=A0A409YHM9_9AGAR|nr:hypothetical protein CVT24_001955 [Panaeolus cyanescens]